MVWVWADIWLLLASEICFGQLRLLLLTSAITCGSPRLDRSCKLKVLTLILSQLLTFAMTRLIQLLIAACILGATLSFAQDNGPTNPKQLRESIATAATEAANKRGLLLDPKIVDQMFASAIICEVECLRAAADKAFLYRIADAYIANLQQLLSGEFPSFGDRLSGGRLALYGWPPNTRADVGIARIPDPLSQARFFIRNATELIPLGQGARSILLMIGPVELLSEIDGLKQRYSVNVPRLGTVALSSQTAGSTAGGVLDAGQSIFCNSPGKPITYTGPLALFNDGRAKMETKPSDLAPYVNQVVLGISVVKDADVKCDQRCTNAIASLFAQAIATWRNGCNRCDPHAMAVVQVQGTTWLDWRLARRVRLFESQPFIPLDLKKPLEGEAEAAPPSPMGGQGRGINHYINISDDIKLKQAICRLQDSASWVAPVQRSMCGSQSDNLGRILRPYVELRNRATTCGEIAVACGLPNDRVEINLKRYRFVVPVSDGAGEVRIGDDSAISVFQMQKVVMHEVGHWFGVPHAEVVQSDKFLDVMSENYSDGENCISEQSLRMLANASDLRWPDRIKGGGGSLMPGRQTPSKQTPRSR